MLFGAAWAAGRLVRRLEASGGCSPTPWPRSKREQAARERALLLDERARIARELHDVVAHAVSVMVVQAGAARFALGADEDEVRERLLSVEDDRPQPPSSDLRRLLDLLRADDAAGPSAGPQPGLDRLAELVDEPAAGRAAGAAGDRRAAGRPAAAVDVTAYRLVQEALTNVLKHSAADWVASR